MNWSCSDCNQLTWPCMPVELGKNFVFHMLFNCRSRKVNLNQPVAKGLSHLFQDHQKGTWKIGMCYTCWLYCALAWCYFPIFWLRDCFIYFELMIAVINKSVLIAVRADGVHCHCDSKLPKRAVCGAASKRGKTIQNFFLPVESWSVLFVMLLRTGKT